MFITLATGMTKAKGHIFLPQCNSPCPWVGCCVQPSSCLQSLSLSDHCPSSITEITRVNVNRMSFSKAREHWIWTACGSTNCSNALPPPANMSFMIEPGDTKRNLSSDFIWQKKFSLYLQPHQKLSSKLIRTDLSSLSKIPDWKHEQIANDWGGKMVKTTIIIKQKYNRSIISELFMTESINLSSPLSQVHFLFQSIENTKLVWIYNY